VTLDKRLRADRLSGIDKVIDDEREDAPTAL
jgi:hypothetical protein